MVRFVATRKGLLLTRGEPKLVARIMATDENTKSDDAEESEQPSTLEVVSKVAVIARIIVEVMDIADE